MKRIFSLMRSMFIKAAYRTAEKNANSACMSLIGQPKVPEQVKALRKF